MSVRAEVVFLWHMHQPEYRDPASGRFRLPWVLLHALKDYADMAAHLEAQPRMRAVVNFVPVLLDQIDDYAEQFASGEFRDPLLAALARAEGRPLDEEERTFLLAQCFAANHERMIAPVPRLRAPARAGQARRRGRSAALPGRGLPRRPARLVPARVDRRDGAPRLADGPGADGQGQRLHGGGPPRAPRRRRRGRHRADPPLPRAGGRGHDRALDLPGAAPDRPAAARLRVRPRGAARAAAAAARCLPGRRCSAFASTSTRRSAATRDASAARRRGCGRRKAR